MAFITLQAKGQLIGALYLGHSQINGLDRVTPILLRTLGSQLTALIENARLYMAEKQRTRELDALYSATAALLNTTLNLELLALLLAECHALPQAGAKRSPQQSLGLITGHIQPAKVLVGVLPGKLPAAHILLNQQVNTRHLKLQML